jgi:signal transduction histidine kinase
VRSLRVRLTAAVLGVLGVVLVTFALLVHVALERALSRQLDHRLADNAAAVAGMAEDDGGPEFEYESLPEFERAVRPGYFQAWTDDGAVLARSPSLGGRDLPRPPMASGPVLPVIPVFHDVTLPDGRPGRAVQLRQPLRIEAAFPAEAPGKSKRFVTVLVSEGTEEVRDTLAGLSRWLWLLAALGLAAGSGAALAIVSRALAPTRALAAAIGRLDEGELGNPLATAKLPAEIAPVVRKLNELLARLAASFARERRFTADVSHELRTPLAALRTTLEVAAAKERDAPAYRAAIADATTLVRQTQSLVENLLTLARLDARQVELQTTEVVLRPFVDDCWRAFQERAAARRLTFANQVGAQTTVTTDADKLRIVLNNLLANAADYTAERGSIAVREGSGGVVFEVIDSGPRIAEELLPRVFDRFSRGDASRAAGVHCGVGLALVSGICALLGLTATAENATDGSVCFRIARA